MGFALQKPGGPMGGNGGMPGGGPAIGGAATQEYSEIIEGGVPSSSGRSRGLLYVVLVVMLLVGGWAAYEIVVNDSNPLDSLAGLVGMGGEGTGDGADPGAVPQPAPSPRASAAIPDPVPEPEPALTPVAGNPYWALPNRILEKSALSRMWSADEEETFRSGLSHRFAYQRWRTVQEVRRRRLQGSDAILWDAMQDKKFWTRMGAAFGLAEMNIEVSLNVLEGLIQSAGSELVADYHERYIRRPSAAHAYMLRQVVRLVDEKGRLIALRGIDRRRDALRDLYLAAATQDPGRRVQKWAAKRLRESPIPKARLDALLAVVAGKAATAPGLPLPPTPGLGDISTAQGKQLPGGPAPKGAPAGGDAGGAEAFPVGGVEIYGDDMVDDPMAAPDPDTFEYSEEPAE